MVAQEKASTAAYVLGTIGTLLWCVQLVPQIWLNFRTKSTEGLPILMVLLFAIAAVPFGVYAIVQDLNLPIQIQPQCFGTLSLISTGQCLRYTYKWRVLTSAALSAVLFLAFAAAEAVMVVYLRPLYEVNASSPAITAIGGAAAACLALALVMPYGEIWKRRGQVVGIDWTFLAIDWSGGVFSLLSLAAQHGAFDAMGGGLYAVCIALETGMFASQAIWLLRTRKRRMLERLAASMLADATPTTGESCVNTVKTAGDIKTAEEVKTAEKSKDVEDKEADPEKGARV